MQGIEASISCSDQPIGGNASASILGESRWLTSWVTPSNLEIQAVYSELTSGLPYLEDRIRACLKYVASRPYISFVQVKSVIQGKTYIQKDAWLEPSEALQIPKINCSNRSFILASLLRQELSPNQVYVTLGNVNIDGQNGHAWCYLKLGGNEYILETTNPKTSDRFIPIEYTKNYEAVVFFNDAEVRMVPGIAMREPFSSCWCIPFLSDYLDKKACYNF